MAGQGKSPIEQYIADKVKELRKKDGITQRKLSMYLDLPSSFVNQVEKPDLARAYNIDHLNELAKILDCSPKDFWPEKPIE